MLAMGIGASASAAPPGTVHDVRTEAWPDRLARGDALRAEAHYTEALAEYVTALHENAGRDRTVDEHAYRMQVLTSRTWAQRAVLLICCRSDRSCLRCTSASVSKATALPR